jgi:hypothetical protein
MSIEEQIAAMPTPADPETGWTHCAWYGCPDKAKPGAHYCLQHRAIIAEKAREIHERVRSISRSMPPVPVIVDCEEYVRKDEESMAYIDPVDQRQIPPTFGEPEPVGDLSTFVVSCWFCAGIAAIWTLGAVFLNEMWRALGGVAVVLLFLFAPAIGTAVERAWRTLCGLLAWGNDTGLGDR